MGDNMKKVSSGDKLQIPAGTFNTFLDAAADFKKRTASIGGNPSREVSSSGIFLIKNNSGADVDRFGVLGIDGPIFTPTDNEDGFKNQIALKGVTPAASSHETLFAILQEPIADGKIGLAMISGVTPVKINVLASPGSIIFANITNGDSSRLVCDVARDVNGGAQILWKESGTGEVWAIVRICNHVFVVDEPYEPGSAGMHAEDATGNPGDFNHLFVKGKMYEDDSENGAVAPYFVLDPELSRPYLLDHQVKVDSADTTEGFLNDEIIVDPESGHAWLEKSVTPGGANDNKLRIEHKDWDGENLNQTAPLIVANLDFGGLEVVTEEPTDGPYIRFELVQDNVDGRKHSQVLSDDPPDNEHYIKLVGKVKVDSADTTPGNLDDEIITDPGGANLSWLKKTVTPGGAADNKLLLEHKDWGVDVDPDAFDDVMLLNSQGGGVELVTRTPATGEAYISVLLGSYYQDDTGHSDLITPYPAGIKNLVWQALPDGANIGDTIYFDGSKYVKLAAPTGAGTLDFVLMCSPGAVPRWVQVAEFSCPS